MSSGDRETPSPLDTPEEWLSIAEAATQLGVSQKTVRRWIKAGRLPATMEDGPYGQQYKVPARAVHTAQHVIDVVKVERPTDPQTLSLAVSRAIEEQQARLLVEFNRRQADLVSEVGRVLSQIAEENRAQVSTLEERVANLTDELAESREAFKRSSSEREAAAEERAERLERGLADVRRTMQAREQAASKPRGWRFWRR